MEFVFKAGILIALFLIAIDLKRIKASIEGGPMGISQWMNHGKKYGYWDYCKRKIPTQDANHIIQK